MKTTLPIKVDKLSFAFGDTKILDDISFNIERGKFYSIIGPNGSGKSTLLKNICRNLSPTHGDIDIEDTSLNKLSNKELAKRLALVPQNTNVDFDFSAFDIVLMGRTPYIGRFKNETQEDLDKTKEAMQITNTWDFKDKLVTKLSGGERQRVIAARALAQDTPILLLDEPTAHLDIHHQIDILDMLKELCITKNLTVVAVLHDLNVAAQYSDDLILLNNKKILSMGNPQKVLTENNINQVYDMNFTIIDNPVTGTPMILPLSKHNK